MTLTFNENNNQEILSNEEQEIILSKFPEKLKPFLNNCNNPLDETQVLVNLFKDKNFRIILREEETKFGDIEWISYYHCEDIAKQINFDTKNINNWNRLWKIKFVKHENLLLNFLGAKIYELNKRRTDKNSNFLFE